MLRISALGSFCNVFGNGRWEKISFLWIAKHRYDMSHIGANICTDKLGPCSTTEMPRLRKR